ncbi:MAG: hypothetical protein U1E83_00540 [Methylotetracoccus sp.]
MKRRFVHGLSLAVLAATLASTASAHEARKVNGYWLFPGFADEPAFEDVMNGPVMFVNDAKFKPVPVADLSDPKKNDISVEVFYYGQRDSKKNWTAAPIATMKLGKMALFSAFFDGYLVGPKFVTSKPGGYGFHFTGLMNGKPLDEKFVCQRGSQDLPASYFDCVSGAYVTPGPRIRGWWPN